MPHPTARYRVRTGMAVAALFLLFCFVGRVSAQVPAAITGVVTDSSGAPVSGADVTAKNIETGAVRNAITDDSGRYQFVALVVGQYEIAVKKTGFRETIRQGIHLLVGQEARIDFRLQIGSVDQQLTVTEEAPPVSATTTDISGLVGERQVKNLPLNGRSYDELMTLDPGVVNFTAEKTGGIGILNSTVGNMFSVSGNRPQQNLFLLNGVEYTGAAENNMQPGGTSQQLLGVDAVREFNVLRDTYGAAYGKRPGGQVSIVTQSGTNQWHGSMYEFVRNSALDAPNFFDAGSAPPFDRNQFGAAVGGPLKSDKTFLFANYEGFRQSLHQTSLAFVPDAASRAAAAPSVVPLLNLWPVAPAGSPDFSGIAEYSSSPLQTIREDFGTTRLDHIFSQQDSANAVYTVDDSADVTASPLNPYTTDIESLREQVLSLEETHIFSPHLLNTARLGFSRAGYFYTNEPTPGTTAVNVAGFVTGHPPGAVVVGGSAASNPQAQLGQPGNNGSNLHVDRNLFTYEDSVALTKGRHQFSVGVWLQRLQSNEELTLSQFGNASFTSLQTFLQGTIATFTYDPAPTPMSWRSWLGAWYAEDVIRLSPRLTVSLGFRDEFTDGWNEANGRAANFIYSKGVILTQPQVGSSVFSINRAKFLAQPRISVAWTPFGSKTVLRAGFGIYNDLQDALGYRLDQNAPGNPTYSIANLSVSQLPVSPAAPPPAAAKVLPAGVQPDLYTPTVESYTLGLERELSPNTSLAVRYVGNHGYHEIVSVDVNEPTPNICGTATNGSCPAVFPAGFGPLTGKPVPVGTYFTPLIGAKTPLPNPALGPTWTWLSEGDSSYNALVVDLNRRFSGGMTLRGAYTWSKALDDGDSLNATAAANAPGLVSNPANIRSDWGPATFDVRNVGVVSASYALPWGRGRRYLSQENRAMDLAIGGWTVNSIVTVQSGFPYTPQLSYNPSNNGDTKNPVRPFVNPNPAPAPVIAGEPPRWFNPNDFIAPPATSGFYGNLGRNTFTGPGLATWDFSAFKGVPLSERLNLELRAEFFNLLNRANFNTPNLIVGTPSGVSPTGGLINATASTSRQIQLGVKLLW